MAVFAKISRQKDSSRVCTPRVNPKLVARMASSTLPMSAAR